MNLKVMAAKRQEAHRVVLKDVKPAMSQDPRLTTWIISAAVYAVSFGIVWLLIICCGVTALRNQNLILFRSLGRAYIGVLMGLATLMHGLNVVAVIVLCIVTNERTIIEVNGALTGIRMWLIAMVFSALVSRQFMLSKIFGTLSKSPWGAVQYSRFQRLWPVLTISSLLWLPMMVFFFLANYFVIGTDIFTALYAVYYLAYIAVFVYLTIKNKGINRVFSDFVVNTVVSVIIIGLVILGVVDTLIFQVLYLDTWIFEMSISYVFGIGFSTCLVILGRPCLVFFFHKDRIHGWEEFNRNNAFIYGGASSQRDRERQLAPHAEKKEVSMRETTQTQHSQDSQVPSQMLSADGIVNELTSH